MHQSDFNHFTKSLISCPESCQKLETLPSSISDFSRKNYDGLCIDRDEGGRKAYLPT